MNLFALACIAVATLAAGAAALCAGWALGVFHERAPSPDAQEPAKPLPVVHPPERRAPNPGHALLYDWDTGTLAVIPEDELAGDELRFRVRAEDGTWVDVYAEPRNAGHPTE